MNHTLTALALSSMLVLSACGGGSGDDSDDEAKKPSASEAVDVVHDSVDSTLGVKSMALDTEANFVAAGQELAFGAEGAMDYENMIGEITISTEQGTQDQEIGIRADGEKVWFRVDGSAAAAAGAAVPQGKTWAEGDVAVLAESGDADPIDLIGVILALRGAEEVEVGDSKEIDGVPTRQFTTTVAYSEAVEAAGDDREAFATAFSLNGVDDADLDIEVWIGDDGVIRDFDLDLDAGDNPLEANYDVDISDANKDVDVPDAPPTDDVLTGPEADAWIAKATA